MDWNKLDNLEILIERNDLSQTKTLLKALDLLINNSQQTLLIRLNFLKEKLKEREQSNIKREIDALLKYQSEIAEKERKEEERKLKQDQENKVEKEKYYKEELKEEERKWRELNSLLIKRSNWKDFKDVLDENNISCFYHFTDKSNIPSIIQNKGLYSWYYCERNNIEITLAGGDYQSRSLDRKYQLQDYVRLSFLQDHPMMYVAIKEGRVIKPVVLEIDREACFLLHTKYSNMNAADKLHKNSDSFDFFKKLRFDLFDKRYFDLSDVDKKYFQAEVMVKTWIPLEYITNINRF